jgi:hypothetical protein
MIPLRNSSPPVRGMNTNVGESRSNLLSNTKRHGVHKSNIYVTLNNIFYKEK